jgi:hypothetical protein
VFHHCGTGESNYTRRSKSVVADLSDYVEAGLWLAKCNPRMAASRK